MSRRIGTEICPRFGCPIRSSSGQLPRRKWSDLHSHIGFCFFDQGFERWLGLLTVHLRCEFNIHFRDRLRVSQRGSSISYLRRSSWLYWLRIFWFLHIGWWSSIRHQHHQSRCRLFYFIPTKHLLRRRDGAKLQAHDSFTIYDADHNLPRSPALRITHELFVSALSRFRQNAMVLERYEGIMYSSVMTRMLVDDWHYVDF